MRKGDKLNFLSILFILLFVIPVELNAYYIRNYSDKDGLSMNIGVSIVQDKKGYIWIATQQGLNRFDGVDVRIFNKKDGLPNDFVNYLYVDSIGNLWAATRGGLALYKDKEEEFISYTTGEDVLFENNVRCIAESKKGGLLLGIDGGLFIKKDKKLVRCKTNEPLLKNRIHAIAVDQEGKTYMGTPGEGLLILYNGHVKKISKKNGGLVSDNIRTLLLDEEGLWIGTDSGINLYSTEKEKCIKEYTKEYSDLSNNGITALFKDRKGNFWIGTADGFFQKKGDTIFIHPKSNYLENNYVRSFCKDHEGGLWLGTSGGVSYLSKSKFTTFSKEDGLPGNVAFGIYQAKDYRIWIATYGGIAVIDDIDENDLKITTYTTKDGLPNNTIRTIAGDKAGNIWIGSLGGLILYENKTYEEKKSKNRKFTLYTSKHGLPNNNVRVVYVDSKDNLWLGMIDGGLVLFDKEKGKIKKIYNIKNSNLLNDNVWFIKEDSKDNLWIGVDEGLCKFDGKNFVNYSRKDGLICKDTHDILEDGDAYWIATLGNGLYHFKDGMFKKYTTKHGLPDNYIHKIVEDNHGWLWLPTNKGVCRFDEKNTFITYTVKDGLPSNENNAHGGIKDNLGRLWFSNPRGVAYINPMNITVNKGEPPVYIEQVRINDKEIDFNGGSTILNYEQNNLYIKFTALSYQYPDAVRFKVRLEGFHRTGEWVEPRGKRFVEYTSLDPGNYTFRVNACNNDGLWNEQGDSFSFTIKPSFFQTLWFYVFLVVIAFLFSYGFYQYRTIQQRGRRKELERMVQERTKELKEMQLKLYQQDKMASLGGLVAGVAHEMNNPANSIYGNIEFLEEFINDIKVILAEYMKMELPSDHKIVILKNQLSIEDKVKELDGLVKYVKEGAVRIADIVKDLRNFARMDEAALQFVDIHEGIETTLNLLHNKIKANIDVVKRFGGIPKIECNPGQINQVFMNLLSNAADAVETKGSITIETSVDESERNVIIKVSDTGEGIPREDIPRIFDPFFTTKPEGTGTGLGLSITHSIIRGHNGIIDKFIGDAIMATFGVIEPGNFDTQKYAEDALRCAFKMREALENFNRENKNNNILEIHFGIGINSGEVIAGDIGAEDRCNYTIIGDVVNKASKIEKRTKEKYDAIFIGEETLNLTKNIIENYEELPPKEDKIKVYQVLELKSTN